MAKIVRPWLKTELGQIGPLCTRCDMCPIWHSPRPAVCLTALNRNDVAFDFEAADRNRIQDWEGSSGSMVLSEAEPRQITC
jgi:hypothetical protein